MLLSRPQKIFTNLPQEITPLPNLSEVQIKSFHWFLTEGLKELFEEISPIRDYTEKEFSLHFDDYFFGEAKTTEAKAKERGLSYEAPLRVNLRLENKNLKISKSQEIYFGDFPIMTKQGTFIINGVERVIVSQSIRSSGVFFTSKIAKGKKLFDAKLIPYRGSWLEFETDSDGVIYVRIDRKRRIPASALLRAFGLVTNEEIEKAFELIDTGANPDGIFYIQETLKKDTAKTVSESYVEIYRRLRPSDLSITVENAKKFIEDRTFFNFDYYDLGRVGRYKMDMKLYNKSSAEILKKGFTRENRVLGKEDLVEVIRKLIALNNDPNSVPDDIDHLSNRRVKTAGELIQSKLRVGLKRLEKYIKDRISTIGVEDLLPSQLINSRILTSAVKEFFTASQLSQFMDQENPLSELEHKRRLSAMGPGGLTKERAGFEVRDVHSSHYGRICPIQTPEGPNIGLINHLSTFARINDLGFIETPYYKVTNAKVIRELVYLTASEEEQYNIAHGGIPYDSNGYILSDEVEVRFNTRPKLIDKNKVDYIDVSTSQMISVATALIPFLEHDDANRALMGSNMQRQAVPSIKPEAPLVASGFEKKAVYDSGRLIISEEDGEVVEVDGSHIVLMTKDGKKTYPIIKFQKSNKFTLISQRPIVLVGQEIKKGQVLADNSATYNGELALGHNLLVAFVPFYGNNFEDAIVLSDRLLKDDLFTSVHIKDFMCDVRDTKLGPEVTTPDISNVSEEKLKDLDEEGIIRVGAQVKARDLLVGKITPKGESDLTPEERLLRSIFGEKAKEVKDTSLRLAHGIKGRVIGTKIFSREYGDKLEPGKIRSIEVDIAQLRHVSIGDKLAGRHGNKGVISKILPVEDMPYLEDGTPVDIILNPLGVISRMNLGQILETNLGWAASKLGYQAITPSLAGPTEEMIIEELKKAGLPSDSRVTLYDGRSGEPFMSKVTAGVVYMLKLNHLADDKIHMRSTGPYSLITQQPLGGKAQQGGQRLGEMEVWALEAYGATHVLQEVLTIKSDDVLGRTSAYDSIIRGERIKNPNIPESFLVLVNELKSLGLSIELITTKSEKISGMDIVTVLGGEKEELLEKINK